jgi:hypothetical protein
MEFEAPAAVLISSSDPSRVFTVKSSTGVDTRLRGA